MPSSPPILEPPTTQPTPPVRAPRGRGRAVVLLVVAPAGLILLTVAILLLSGNGSEPHPPVPGGPSPPTTVSAAESIVIPNAGSAMPYPSTIDVTNMRGVVTDVNVTLNGFNHAFPTDVGVLLVAPDGTTVALMAGVGGFDEATDLRLTFDDEAPGLKASRQVVSGTFRPSSGEEEGSGFGWPPPAPGGPYGTALSDLNDTDPNGTWQLFVFDSSDRDGGRISGGWSLHLQLGAGPAPVEATEATGAPT